MSALIARRPLRISVMRPGRHAEIEREPIGAEASRGELAFQQPAWVHDGRHRLSPVIIHDFYVESIALAKLETKRSNGRSRSLPIVLCGRL